MIEERKKYTTVSVTFVLFADDTTNVGRSWGFDSVVRAGKSVTNEREERNNDAKEDFTEFWTKQEGTDCLSSSWLTACVKTLKRASIVFCCMSVKQECDT